MKKLFSAFTASALMLGVLAQSAFAAAIDPTDEIGTLVTDLMGTVAIVVPLVLAVGLGLIAVGAGVNFIFSKSRKGANQK